MHDVDLVYVVTRAHAFRTYLIPFSIIKRDLINVKSLEEFVSFLHMTYYRDPLTAISEINLENVVGVFKKCFVDRFKRFINMTPSKYLDLIDAYTYSFDVDSVLQVVAEKISGVRHRSPEYYAPPFSKIDIERFISMEDIEQCIELLKETPFCLEKDVIDMWKKYRAIYIIEMALRRQIYVRYVAALEKVSDEDRKGLLEIIGTEIDMANISIVIGPMLYGYSPSIAWRMLIPFEYRVNLNALKKAYGLESDIILKLVPDIYRGIVEYYLAGLDMKAKSLARRMILRKILSVLPRYPINYTYVFGIIKLLEYEYKNLKMIAEALDYGISPREIKDLLILDEPL